MMSSQAPSERSARTPRQALVNNEQVKLTASTTNALAIAFMIGGGAGLYTAFGSGIPWFDTIVAMGRAVFWISVGGILHVIARHIPRNLV